MTTNEKVKTAVKVVSSHKKEPGRLEIGVPQVVTVEVKTSTGDLIFMGVGTLKEFSTGSIGWNVAGKGIVGEFPVQIGTNVVIIGSKNL